MVMNVPLQIASINRELENRGISPDTIDVKALIDPTLSLPENRDLILSKFAGTEAGNIRQSKGLDEEMTAQFCDYVSEECIKGDKEACRAACKECGQHCEPQIVQVQDKKTKEFVKIDTKKGEIVSRRKNRYKGVPEVRKKRPCPKECKKPCPIKKKQKKSKKQVTLTDIKKRKKPAKDTTRKRKKQDKKKSKATRKTVTASLTAYPEGGLKWWELKQGKTTDTMIVKLEHTRPAPKVKISSPLDVVKFLKEMEDYDREHAKLIHLDTKNQVVGVENISTGSLNASIVHPRETLKGAILNNSASVIFVHNHPSGDPTPSREDRSIFESLKEAFKIVGIDLLDSIVIGRGKYHSLKEG